MPTWMQGLLFFGAVLGGVVLWDKIKERGGRTGSFMEGAEAVGGWLGGTMERVFDLLLVVLGLTALYFAVTDGFSWGLFAAGLFLVAFPLLRRLMAQWLA